MEKEEGGLNSFGLMEGYLVRAGVSSMRSGLNNMSKIEIEKIEKRLNEIEDGSKEWEMSKASFANMCIERNYSFYDENS